MDASLFSIIATAVVNVRPMDHDAFISIVPQEIESNNRHRNEKIHD